MPLILRERVLTRGHGRLITLYQLLHDNIHAKSGQGEGLKLQYFKTDKEAVMGWVRFFTFLISALTEALLSRSRRRSSCTLLCRRYCQRVRL